MTSSPRLVTTSPCGGIQSAAYYFIQAGHRETAINAAIDAIRFQGAEVDTSVSVLLFEPVNLALWVIETLIQGAWIREYHEWEKATITFFDIQHTLNKLNQRNWRSRKPGETHVVLVQQELSTFGISNAELDSVLSTISQHREKINKAKHESDYFVKENELAELILAIGDFWNVLADHQEFRPA